LADHDAGPRRVDVDLRLVGGALDVDLRDACMVQALLQEVPDLDVLVQQVGVLPARKPARVPVLGDVQPESLRMDFLSHAQASAPLRRSSTTTVMWLLRLKTGVARPWARGVKRFAVGPSSTQTRFTKSASTSTRCPCSALATADRRVLATMRAAFLGVYSRIPSAFSTGWPRIMLTTKRAFCAVTREKRLVARASMATCPSGPRRAPPGHRRSRPCPSDRPNGRGRCAWARIHPACDRRRSR